MKEFNAYVNKKIIIGINFLFLLMPLWLQADDVLTQTPLPADPLSSVGRVTFTLLGMIAFILLLAYLAKRLQGMTRTNIGGISTQGKMIQTLATTSIGLKEKISLIQVGNQQLLIGITPQSIQTLLVLDKLIPQEDIDQQSPIFQAIFKKALHKV